MTPADTVPCVRIALVYDCIHPPSVGGAERWLRALALDLARDHDVTYLTRRQWSAGEDPIPGVRCIALSPGGSLTDAAGRRRLLSPLAFGAGVLVHLLRHRRRYDVVHCLSYPYLSVLAARLALAGGARRSLVVEWLECLTPGYWRSYAGRVGGAAGRLIQWLCVRATPLAVCFSEHSRRRLLESGLRAPAHVLGGLWEPESELPPPSAARPETPFILFAGRHVPDKRVTAIPAATALARAWHPDLHAVVVGDGPLRPEVGRRARELGLNGVVELPGFVARERLAELMHAAACVVAPSRRDGHGMVVAEAAAAGTPVVGVAGPDSAVSELIEEGVNGAVSPSAEPGDLAAAIDRVLAGGPELRAHTTAWWQGNRERLSAAGSIARLRRLYAERVSEARPPPA